MGRQQAPGMIAFQKLRNCVGELIGNKGPIASIVAKKYIEKIPKNDKDKITIFEEACKLIKKDTKDNINNIVQKATAEYKQKRAAGKRKKKDKPVDYSETTDF